MALYFLTLYFLKLRHRYLLVRQVPFYFKVKRVLYDKHLNRFQNLILATSEVETKGILLSTHCLYGTVLNRRSLYQERCLNKATLQFINMYAVRHNEQKIYTNCGVNVKKRNKNKTWTDTEQTQNNNICPTNRCLDL